MILSLGHFLCITKLFNFIQLFKFHDIPLLSVNWRTTHAKKLSDRVSFLRSVHQESHRPTDCSVWRAEHSTCPKKLNSSQYRMCVSHNNFFFTSCSGEPFLCYRYTRIYWPPALACIAIPTTTLCLRYEELCRNKIMLKLRRWYEWILWGNNCFRCLSLYFSHALALYYSPEISKDQGVSTCREGFLCCTLRVAKKFPRFGDEHVTKWGKESNVREQGHFLFLLYGKHWHDSEFCFWCY